MSWETRGGRGRYYTRSRRVNGRVIREYIGSGELAELIAEMDEILRIKRDAERAAWRAEKERLQRLEQPLEELDRICNLLVKTSLEAEGYYRHNRGEWRKRRVRR